MNGATYGTSTPLLLPSSFSFTIDVVDCAPSVITTSIVLDITLTVWDTAAYYPASGTAFADFTDSVSTASGNPNTCLKEYTATVSTNEDGNSLTYFSLQTSTK